MNQPHHAPHRRQRRPVHRLLTVTAAACVAAGGICFALSCSTALNPESRASSCSTALNPESMVSSRITAPEPESAALSAPADSAALAEENSLLSAQQAAAILSDPRMVLVNRQNRMPEDYTFTTRECGSATAINKTLQTEAADAFLAMQAAAAEEGVTVWMQSGYRSVEYQEKLYTRKTQYYLDKGFSRDEALQRAAAVVNPPGCSEHNCGLAAALNSPEHTGLDEGFENTEAFRWLCAHAEDYGFILRYPKGAEAVTGITYEPWHWRYVGKENAALLNRSGLCLEDAAAVLQQIAAGKKVIG